MAGVSFVVVVVVVMLVAEESRAQLVLPPYGPLGGIPGIPFGFQQQHQPPPEPLMTCISVNPQDPSAQLRLTVRSETYGRNGFAFGQTPFVGFGGLAGPDPNVPQNWVVEGIISPGGSLAMQGTTQFHVVVTQFGRTTGGTCHAQALGPAIDGVRAGPFQLPFGPLGGFGGYLLGQGLPFQQHPSGVLSNPVVMTRGVSSYTARLQGVSFNQINGGGMALCPQLSQDHCIGIIPMCCPITRDQVPATQPMLSPVRQTTSIDLGSVSVTGFPAGQPLGVAPVGTGGMGIVGGNTLFDGPELGGGGLFADGGIGFDRPEATTAGLF